MYTLITVQAKKDIAYLKRNGGKTAGLSDTYDHHEVMLGTTWMFHTWKPERVRCI